MNGASVTRLLSRVRNGDKEAEASLFELVYEELRKIASRNMRGERAGHVLQTTALVHEAYLRLVRTDDAHFETRNHFFAFAAQIMRRILVDHARGNAAMKRGAGFTMTSLDECAVVSPEPSVDILALDVVLERLSVFDSRQAKVVEMRFFAGMKEEEIADVLGISARTVKRDWTMAKAWLYGELRP